jgi:hypothetical protein
MAAGIGLSASTNNRQRGEIHPIICVATFLQALRWCRYNFRYSAEFLALGEFCK